MLPQTRRGRLTVSIARNFSDGLRDGGGGGGGGASLSRRQLMRSDEVNVFRSSAYLCTVYCACVCAFYDSTLIELFVQFAALHSLWLYNYFRSLQLLFSADKIYTRNILIDHPQGDPKFNC